MAETQAFPRVGKHDPNPRPDLFTTFERLETCHRTEVTADNIHLLAQYFGCSVDYSGEQPVLRDPTNHPVKVGGWIDVNGSGWNPDPLTQGWSPANTYADATLAAPVPHPAATDPSDGGAV